MSKDLLDRLLRQRPHLSFAANSPEDHKRWVAQVRSTVRRLAGVGESPDFEPLVATRSRRHGLEVYDLVFPPTGAIRPTGRLLRPPGAERFPTVLICPGRNASLDQVTGAVAPQFPDQDLGRLLARRGIATMTMGYDVMGTWPEERIGGRDEVNLLGLALGLTGRSVLGVLTEAAVGCLAWLEREPWLGVRCVAVLGRSLGGFVAMHAALARERPLPVALACCMGLYRNMFGGSLTAGAGHALPGILRFAELPDLAAALAPWPLHIQHGREDPVLPIADVESALVTVRASYGVVDGGALDVQLHDGGHSVDVTGLLDFLVRNDAIEPDRSSIPPAKVVFDASARAEILDRIDDALSTGQLTLGQYGERLEKLAQQRTGAPYIAAVSSGTAALELACRIAGVEGRTVLVPANTFFATAEAVLHAGAKVAFVDTEPVGLGMDPMSLRVALDTHTDVAAVVVVHIGGIIAPSVLRIADLCVERGLALIEDAAHALGSQLDDIFAGDFGRLAAFSMYPTKIVTSGEGGLVGMHSTSDLDLARSLRDQGKLSFTSNVHGYEGNNWRLSEPHASIGIAHIERLEYALVERRRLAAFYDEWLEAIPRIRPFRVPARSRSNYYKYIAVLDDDVDRTQLRRNLRSRHGVALAGEVYEIPCTSQPFFGGRYPEEIFPTAARFCRHHLALPIFRTMTQQQQERVVYALDEELRLGNSRCSSHRPR